MKKKLLLLLTIFTLALWVVPASAVTQTFPLPADSVSSGGPVSATVKFIIDDGADTLTVDLWNTLINPENVAQNVSDLFFKLTTGETSGSLTSSLGIERTVAAGGTFTPGGSVDTGWVLEISGTIFHLNGLGSAAEVPAHTIIGLPDGSNLYSNANASIAGNNSHNPFLFGTEAAPVQFVLSIPGMDATTRVTDVVFSFGTTPGDDVNVPIPPSALLLGSGLLGLGILRFRRA
jgi:hypothetical protein